MVKTQNRFERIMGVDGVGKTRSHAYAKSLTRSVLQNPTRQVLLNARLAGCNQGKSKLLSISFRFEIAHTLRHSDNSMVAFK